MNVLYVEDNPSDADLLKRALSRTAPQITLEWVATCAEARTKLGSCAPRNLSYDVILTDMELSDGNGVSFVPFLKERQLPIAVVVLEEIGGEESVASALKAGASSYAIKYKNYLALLPGILENACRDSRTMRDYGTSGTVESFYHSLMDNITDLILIIDKDSGSVLFVSKSFERVLEYAEEEIREMEPFAIVHPDDRSLLANAVTQTALNPGTTGPTIELRLRHKEGSWHWFEGTGNIVLSISNRMNIVITVHDITKRKQAEDELKRKEAFFRTLVEKSSEVILLLDHDNRRIYVSQSVESIFGYTVEEFLSQNRADYIHPDFMDISNENRRRAMEHPGEPVTFISRIRHKNGSWRWIEITARNLLHDPDVRASVINFHDITERRQTEEALKASEERFRSLVEQSSEGIVLVDINKKLTYLSPAVSRILGYSPEEYIIAQATEESIHPDDRADVAANHLWADNHPGEAITSVIRRLHKDGTWRWIKSTIRNLLEDPNVRATVVNFRDITERKEAEEALLAKTAFLEAQVNSSPDGILVVDDKGRKNLQNQRMKDLWGLPEDIFNDFDDTSELTHAMNMVKDPQQFYEKVMYLYAHNDITSRDEIELKDGRVYDRYTAPVLDRDGRYYGRIWTFRDITDRKTVEKELRESGERLKLKLDSILSPTGDIGDEELNNILDIPAIQSLMDSFYALTDIGLSITDLRGNILASTGWQDMCAKFHRVHPETAQNCIDSTRLYARDISEGAYKSYRCKNNLNDAATPVFIGDKLVGNFFCGQFLYDDEDADFETFSSQADKYGFDKEGYLAAFRNIRRLSRDKLENGIVFLSKFSTLISKLSYGNIKLARSIEEQKRFEKALLESETKYRTVVENSLAGFYIIQDGLFRFVNKRFCKIFGYLYEEIVDKLGPVNFTYPEDANIVEENLDRRLTGRADNIEYEFRAMRKDGTVMNMKVLGGSTMLNGRPAATGTIIDITREKMLEAQLRQSQKMEALGTLAGGVAHDFNNILTVLTGYGSLLKTSLDEKDPLWTYADQITSAAHKAAHLTESLLAFSRQQSITLEPLDINGTVRNIKKMLKRLLIEDITLKIELSQDTLIIMGDATQIDQILFNLSTNARDAMPKGGTLTIETKQVNLGDNFTAIHGFDRPGKYALISVSDSGVGMDNLTIEHIFDPFFTTKEVGKGTGLGLSIIYGIVKEHNGYVTVYSEPGIGTTFHIYLPLIEAVVQEDKVQTKHIRGGKETILIAEDSKEVRRIMRYVLTEYGYTIVEAIDGEDAIEKFKEQGNIHLLILDSVMPKKNGRAAYDEISAMNKHVKVLFTSGYTRDIVLNKGIEDRKFDFISKPLSPRELLEKVREVLDRGQ
jgi:PAS domain S-box-containing protein